MAKQAKQVTLAMNQTLALQAVRAIGGADDATARRRGELVGVWGGDIHEQILTTYPQSLISIGTVYVTLEELEDRGYLTSFFEDPADSGRVGRPRKYYAITAAGDAALDFALAGIRNGEKCAVKAVVARRPALANR
jgi:hypothetical protein